MPPKITVPEVGADENVKKTVGGDWPNCSILHLLFSALRHQFNPVDKIAWLAMSSIIENI